MLNRCFDPGIFDLLYLLYTVVRARLNLKEVWEMEEGKGILEKIDSDLKEAMKKKDSVKVSTIRMLRAAIKNLAIEKRTESLEEADVLQIISKQVKQHKDSIGQFIKGGRTDLAEKESQELEILKSYLPPALSNEEIVAIVNEAIAEVGAQTKRDMGKVMKVVMEKVRGRADGKTVSQVVAEQLK